jgi:CHAD domain-containing protein
VARWREVEVELAEGDEALLERSAKWLTRAGAAPSTTGSKVARAIGSDGRRVADAGSLEALLHSYLAAQYAAVVAGDIGLRRGSDVVHPTRVATRRFRSVLRVCADLFDEPRAVALDAELKWYAQALGRLRDVQVLRAHLAEAVGKMRDESLAQRVSIHLDGHFAMDEDIARSALDAVMDSRRYATLLDELRAWIEEVPVPSGRPDAAVRTYLRNAERTLRRRMRGAGRRSSPDDAMHRARKAAKRARYIAELATPVVGKRAEKQVARTKKLQDSFGTLQDAIVATEFLHRAARDAESEVAFAIGLLWRDEQDRARRARKAARKRAKKLLAT